MYLFLQIYNADVSGHAGLYDVLRHDFWGQDIKLVDSHKSYRPITVLTFKFNFALSGLSEFGFHLTNLIIYSAVCVIVYQVALQWLNRHGRGIPLQKSKIIRLMNCCLFRRSTVRFAVHSAPRSR